MSAADRFDATLLKALGHPLRLRILEAINDRGEASPVRLAREFKQPLATVSHHARVLRDLGWLELARTEPRRGAVEHFYRAVKRPFIDDEEWEQLPLSMRRGLARQTFRRIFSEAAQAGADGGFDCAGAHITRSPLELDSCGRRELSALVLATLEEAEEIERRSQLRGASADGHDGPVTPSELAILHFRLAKAVSATTPAAEGQRPPGGRPPLRS
jgi:DNA-binding transcriptional ArsR family regulator